MKDLERDNSCSAALPEQPPSTKPISQDSVAELKAWDLMICKAEKRRFIHCLFSPPWELSLCFGHRCSDSVLVTVLETEMWPQETTAAVAGRE